MLFATSDDIKSCTQIVSAELNKANVSVTDKVLHEITIDVMNISYAKGGDYSPKMIQRLAETYVAHKQYRKILPKEV